MKRTVFYDFTNDPSVLSFQVPVVAILGSGGGFRAMVGFSGVMKALYESGILDCATYVAGLSGSTWLVYVLYLSNIMLNVSHLSTSNLRKEDLEN